MEGHPFNMVAKPLTREYSRLKSISTNTFMKYMGVLTKGVEKAVANELPEQFALVIDGWSLKGGQSVVSFLMVRAVDSLFGNICVVPFQR